MAPDAKAKEARRKADAADKEARNALTALMNATGGKTASAAIRDLKHRINEARSRDDEIEEQLQNVEHARQGLARQKKQVDDKSVFGLSDVPQEGAEKAGEKLVQRHFDKKATEEAIRKAATEKAKREIAKQGVKSTVGRATGWAGLFGDVVEYGGKKLIKEDLSRTLRDYIRRHDITATQLIELQIKLRTAMNRDYAAIERIKKLKAEVDRSYDAYLAADEAATKAEAPASSHADTRRVFDKAGDAEEKRLAEKERRRAAAEALKKAKIEVAPPRKRTRSSKKRSRRAGGSRYHDSHFKRRRSSASRERRRRARRARRERNRSGGVRIGVSLGSGFRINF